MKTIRLLPVVIFAALALLLFKGIGLVSNGSYVLTGTEMAQAEGDAHAGSAEADGTTLEMPKEVTMADTSPTLGDTAPTMGLKGDASAEAGGEHGGTAAEGEMDSAHAGANSIPNIDCPVLDATLAEPAPEGAAAADPHATTPAVAERAAGCPTLDIPLTESGDAVATTKTPDGKIVTLASVNGEDNEAALLERLGARRTDLDKFAADLDMRAALVEAAEKRLDERTMQLKDLEAQISALVDQKQATEDAQFKAVISMYETMKARDAAKIFDALDLYVLVRLARAINPRKMAPILAAMDATRAKDLTSAMAMERPPATVAEAGENLANLPQIVGN